VFVDRETFEERIRAGGFAEWTEFAGTGELYGTPTLNPRGPGPDNRDVVLEIELDGAQQIKRRYPEAVLILIVAPGPADQEARLRGRGDDADSARRRLEVGALEEQLGRRIADHVVVNDDIDRAARELADILQCHRSGC
jgi:guanylate kinase